MASSLGRAAPFFGFPQQKGLFGGGLVVAWWSINQGLTFGAGRKFYIQLIETSQRIEFATVAAGMKWAAIS